MTQFLYSTLFPGVAISALDCGFPLTTALNETISTNQFDMLANLLPKVSDNVLKDCTFKGDQNLLHRLATVSQQAEHARAEKLLKVAGSHTVGSHTAGSHTADSHPSTLLGSTPLSLLPFALVLLLLPYCCSFSYCSLLHQALYSLLTLLTLVVQVASSLLQKGLQLEPDGQGQNPLHIAAASQNHSLLIHLMKVLA